MSIECSHDVDLQSYLVGILDDGEKSTSFYDNLPHLAQMTINQYAALARVYGEDLPDETWLHVHEGDASIFSGDEKTVIAFTPPNGEHRGDHSFYNVGTLKRDFETRHDPHNKRRSR
jgi:hypothetical protein